MATLPSAISLAVLGLVPSGIFILYLPSCSGKTRRFFCKGTSSLSGVDVDEAIFIDCVTLRRFIGDCSSSLSPRAERHMVA